MFQRFTEPARMVVVLAQDEARALGHEHLGTEHLLVGLLRARDGLAGRVLRSLGVTVDDVQAEVVRAFGRGGPTTTGQIPFTPRAQAALELALREALSLGHDYIGTEHVLLGLVGDGASGASRILRAVGFDSGAVREEVLRLLGETAAREPPAADDVAPTAAAPVRAAPPVPAARPVRDATRRTWSLGAVVAGWLAFGVAVGIGLLLGRLIWG